VENKNKNYFEYKIYTRENGHKFIKILVYSNEGGGYVEVGRINLTRSEWVRDNFSIEEVLDDIKI
jgi:hypothetical protein